MTRRDRAPTKPTTPRLVLEDYGKSLKSAAEQVGLPFEKLAELAGISTVTAWRVTVGTGSVKAANAMRTALMKYALDVGGSVEIPPPVLSTGSLDVAEWISLGERLLAADPDQFAKTLASVKKIVEGVAALSN